MEHAKKGRLMRVGEKKFKVDIDSKYFLIDLDNEHAVKKVWGSQSKITDDVYAHVLYKLNSEYYLIVSNYVLHTVNVLLPVQEARFCGIALIKKEDLHLLDKYPSLNKEGVLKNRYEDYHLLNIKSRIKCTGFDYHALNDFVIRVNEEECWFSDSGDAFFFKYNTNNLRKMWEMLDDWWEELGHFKIKAYREKLAMFKED